MNKNNFVVAIYPSHTTAEAAIKELQQSGFDMKKLSIVGRDYHTDELVVGYYNTGDRMKAWGKTGAFWGGLWGFPYYYDDGVYYQQMGGDYQAVYPPVGANITGLPDGAIAINGSNCVYYYAGGAFYMQQDGGYVIVPTPIGVTVPELPPGAVQISINGGVAYQFNGVDYQPVFVNGVTQYTTFTS